MTFIIIHLLLFVLCINIIVHIYVTCFILTSHACFMQRWNCMFDTGLIINKADHSRWLQRHTYIHHPIISYKIYMTSCLLYMTSCLTTLKNTPKRYKVAWRNSNKSTLLYYTMKITTIFWSYNLLLLKITWSSLQP